MLLVGFSYFLTAEEEWDSGQILFQIIEGVLILIGRELFTYSPTFLPFLHHSVQPIPILSSSSLSILLTVLIFVFEPSYVSAGFLQQLVSFTFTVRKSLTLPLPVSSLSLSLFPPPHSSLPLICFLLLCTPSLTHLAPSPVSIPRWLFSPSFHSQSQHSPPHLSISLDLSPLLYQISTDVPRSCSPGSLFSLCHSSCLPPYNVMLNLLVMLILFT